MTILQKLVVVSNLNQHIDAKGGQGEKGGNPTDVSVHGSGIEGGFTGTPSSFTINTMDVGAGTLSITVDGPSKVDLACNEVNYLIIVI